MDDNTTGIDEKRVAAALSIARDKLRVQLDREPNGLEIILRVFEFLVDIDGRTPKGTPRETGNCWADHIHELDERIEAAKQRLIDEAAGDDIAMLLGLRPKPTEEEIDTALSINTAFFSSLRGEKRWRDWQILRYVARKMTDTQIAMKLNADALKELMPHQQREAIARLDAGESQADVAKSYDIEHITRQRVSDRKQVQLAAIWNAVQHLMPAPTKSKRTAPKKTGVIWRAAA
jgi:hypothetical protein